MLNSCKTSVFRNLELTPLRKTNHLLSAYLHNIEIGCTAINQQYVPFANNKDCKGKMEMRRGREKGR